MGRWPVRSGEDLEHIIASSMAWSNRDRTQGSALAIAEHTVAGEGIDFGAALDGVVSQLPGGLSTTRVYVDEILGANPGLSLPQALAQAKGQIIDGLNASPDIVLYNGHATTSQLSNKGLFKAQDVAQVRSARWPAVVTDELLHDLLREHPCQHAGAPAVIQRQRGGHKRGDAAVQPGQ